MALRGRRAGGKIGYINRKLNLVIPATYDGAYPFRDGVAVVCTACTIEYDRTVTEGERSWYAGGQWGRIDRRGRLVSPFRSTARPFCRILISTPTEMDEPRASTQFHVSTCSETIPSGTYDPTRLANLSIGYIAVDSGVGYTYLNPHTGNEFSAVAGLTYNGMNDALQYRNGIDFHLDWAMSQFVSKSVHVGIVGYVYQQLTGDGGAGANFGDFKGHSVSLGPQMGFFFPAFEGYTGYLNVRGYWEVVT